MSALKNLSLIIESFTDWGKPWLFFKYVIENPNIIENEITAFSKIYQEASKFELWNYPDLIIGVNNATQYLKDHTALSEKSIKQIVNAISYEWK